MILEARAKINIMLDVIGKRPDGYHDLRMISQTIALHDTVELDALDFRYGIQCSCDDPMIPQGAGNIAYKAAQAFFSQTGIAGGARIRIKKRVPSSAGLGGGSSDAAAVLIGLDRLYGTSLSDAETDRIGLSVGADVPFCLHGGTMLVEGIGERLIPLPSSGSVPLIIIKPPFGVSTAMIYGKLRLSSIKEEDRPDIDHAVAIMQKGSALDVAGSMRNVLENVTITEYPDINDLKSLLIRLGAEGSVMSGSGPAVFGIFKTPGAAKKAFDILKSDNILGKQGYNMFLTRTV